MLDLSRERRQLVGIANQRVVQRGEAVASGAGVGFGVGVVRAVLPKGKLQSIGAVRTRRNDRRRWDRRRVSCSEETADGELTSERCCSPPAVRTLRDLRDDRGGSEVNHDVVGVLQNAGL